MTCYVDGFLPSIRTVVARFPGNQPRYEMTYERLLQFARDVGHAFHARANALRRITKSIPAQTTDLNSSRPNHLTRTSSLPCTEKVLAIVEPKPSEFQLHISAQ